MKKTFRWALLGAVILLCGCDRRETVNQRIARFRHESEVELQKCCEGVTGYRRILDKSIYRTNDNPAQWTGLAAVEDINELGGVQTMRIRLMFRQHADVDNVPHVYCFEDPNSIMERAFREGYKRGTQMTPAGR